MKNAKNFIEDGMNPQIIIKGYKRALEESLTKLESLIIKLEETPEERKKILVKCA